MQNTSSKHHTLPKDKIVIRKNSDVTQILGLSDEDFNMIQQGLCMVTVLNMVNMMNRWRISIDDHKKALPQNNRTKKCDMR